MDTYKNFAIDIAQQAGEIMKNNFSLGMKKEWKDDDTPITITDSAINHLVIEAVKKQFPKHAVLGEEESNIKKSEYTWVCDPLDGTIPFSHGYPTFVFSLALTKNGESILGVIYDPIMNRLAVAEKGKGAYLNGQKITVSQTKKLTSQTIIDIETDFKLIKLREKLIEKNVFVSTLYGAVYASLLTACGEFVAEIYEHDKPWDGAAVKIVVEEAGGKVTDLLGNDQRYDQPINGYIASNGYVHEELVQMCKEILHLGQAFSN